MMHMPGKGLGAAGEGVRGGGEAWGAPLLKLSPLPRAGGAPLCSPPQYKDCAHPALGKGQASPASRPHPALPATSTPRGGRP